MTTKYAASWFKRAEEDLASAKILLEKGGTPNQVCFHSQQATEKLLKGFLATHAKHTRKIHDLLVLLEECRKIDPSFVELQAVATHLNQFYVHSRYPDDFIEFSRAEAEKGLQLANQVMDFVLPKADLIGGTSHSRGFVLVQLLVILLLAGAGVWGYVQRPSYLNIFPEGLTHTPTASPTDNSTATWQTYRNEQYGFEVKYPPTTKPEEHADTVSFGVPGTYGYFPEITVFENKTITATIPTLLAYYGTSGFKLRVNSTADYSLDGKNGKEIITKSSTGISFAFILVEKDRRLYQIFLPEPPRAGNESSLILSTFKFVK